MEVILVVSDKRKLNEFGDPTELGWGKISLVQAPKAGDWIQITRSDDQVGETVEVLRLIHHAVPIPLPETVAPSAQLNKPYIEVVGKFLFDSEDL